MLKYFSCKRLRWTTELWSPSILNFSCRLAYLLKSSSLFYSIILLILFFCIIQKVETRKTILLNFYTPKTSLHFLRYIFSVTQLGDVCLQTSLGFPYQIRRLVPQEYSQVSPSKVNNFVRPMVNGRVITITLTASLYYVHFFLL